MAGFPQKVRHEAGECRIHCREAKRGLGRTKKHHSRLCTLIIELTKRSDIVENPETASMCCNDQVVTVNCKVAHRNCRQVELKRLPVVAIIKRDKNSKLSARKQEPASLWIYFDRLHIYAGG